MAKTIEQMRTAETSLKAKVEKTEARFAREVLKAGAGLSQSEILGLLRADASRRLGQGLPFPKALGGE